MEVNILARHTLKDVDAMKKSMLTTVLPYLIWEIRDPLQLHTERRRAEVTLSLLKPHRNDMILDVGCSVGYQISYITKSASSIVGVDISPTRLIEAKKRIKEAEFICASSEKLPFRFEVFDKVTCLELIEHLGNPSKTLNEIDMVLKKKGTLIVSVPYRERMGMIKCIHCGKPTPARGHLHSFDESKLSSLLPKHCVPFRREYVATAISSYPFFGFLPVRVWKTVDYFSRLLPHLKAYWLIVAFKKEPP